MQMSNARRSEFYIKYINELGNRLDENYYHPKYNEIEVLLSRVKYETISVGDTRTLICITKGKTPRGLTYIEDGGIPFLRAGNIVDEIVDIDSAPRISEEFHRSSQLEKSQLRKGNVLVTMAGTIGQCAVYDHENECNCNQAVGILTIDPKAIYPEYLVKCLNSRLGQLQFGKLQKMADQPNVGFEEIKSIRIPYPSSIDEQEIIVEKVKMIEKEMPLIDKKIEEAKEAANQLILNELNFPISERMKKRRYYFKTGKDERSPFFFVYPDNLSSRLTFVSCDPDLDLVSNFEKQYSTISLDKVVDIIKGEQPEYTEEESGIIAVKTVDIKDGYIDYNYCLNCTTECFDKFATAHIAKNDVLVTCTGYISLGKVDVYESDKQAMAAQDIAILRLKNEYPYDPYFLTYFMRSILGKLQFEKWWIGSSGQIHLEPEDLKKFIVPDNTVKGVIPEKQKAIGKKITIALSKVTLLQNQKKQIMIDAQREFSRLVGI